MPALVIRNIPPELHRKLKQQAALHHRSMTREALALLEAALLRGDAVQEVPAPYRGGFPLDGKFIDDAKRKGRA